MPAHMCRNEHEEIWHNNSEIETCPLCVLIAEKEVLLEAVQCALAHQPREEPDPLPACCESDGSMVSCRLEKMLQDAIDFCEQAPKKKKWQPGSTAPKDGRWILGWQDKEQAPAVIYWDDSSGVGKWDIAAGGASYYDYTPVLWAEIELPS